MRQGSFVLFHFLHFRRGKNRFAIRAKGK